MVVVVVVGGRERKEKKRKEEERRKKSVCVKERKVAVCVYVSVSVCKEEREGGDQKAGK